MKYFISLILISGVLFCCTPRITKSELLNPNNRYPRWLKSENYRTYQTSGITFISEDENGNDEFLLIDDIGKLHRLKILNDTTFAFTKVNFSKEVSDYLNSFPKIDFEEITYDNFSGEVYITIEGNGPDFLQYNGIYKLKFEAGNIASNYIVGIEKLDITPIDIYTSFIKENIGYEGLAVSKNYLYLGLEGILNEDNSFSDSTLILIVDKSELIVLKEIYTGEFNIASICGLYSESDLAVWGIDRNKRTLFNLNFSKNLKVKSHLSFKVKTVIPFYGHYEYTGSLESLTMNNKKEIFLVDDPWYSRFVPDSLVLKGLDNITINNFKDFVPIIHKIIIE